MFFGQNRVKNIHLKIIAQNDEQSISAIEYAHQVDY